MKRVMTISLLRKSNPQLKQLKLLNQPLMTKKSLIFRRNLKLPINLMVPNNQRSQLLNTNQLLRNQRKKHQLRPQSKSKRSKPNQLNQLSQLSQHQLKIMLVENLPVVPPT